jgi:signal transduction histidine kinase
MKFTFKGFIKVKAKACMIKGRNCVNISVVDTGVGIKKKNLEKLFKLFTKIERTASINESGVGLGLMISYKYSKILTY